LGRGKIWRGSRREVKRGKEGLEVKEKYNSDSFLLCSAKGMDTEKFKYKWGGEDWDLLDRVFNAKLEVERIKYPGLYHHYHSKQKKWN